MYSKLITGFFISSLIVFIEAIDLKPIRLPSVVTEGSSVYLECKFDLEGFNLEAVKWRKNKALFYKYQPDDPQGIKRSFPVQGVNANLRYSNATHVFLENVDFNTQGTYSCDVISKDPFQKEVSSEDRLTVVHSDFLFTPLGNTGPRLQNIRRIHLSNPDSTIHSDLQIGSQGSVIISPETQKERTVTTTLKKSSTLVSDNHHGPALHHDELENVRARLSNTIDLSKLKNLNYNQHHDYYIGRDGSRLHFDQTSTKKVKTVDSDYFPVELGPHIESPRVIHTDLPEERHVTTVKKPILSPKQQVELEKLKQDPNHVHPTPLKHIDGPQRSGRYEVEEDSIASRNNPNHHHHPAPGGVYTLTPEQYADFRFFQREPGDVVLFKPVANHSQSSTSFNQQPSWLLLKLTLFMILIVNNIFRTY